jgi:CRP-like cAMP-binding protein
MTIDPVIYSYVSEEERYPPDAAIVKEGDRGYWVYIILEGRCKVKKRSSRGTITLASLQVGDIFGEMSFFIRNRLPRTTTIVADGPVLVGILDTDRLNKELKKLSPRLKQVVEMMFNRLREASDKVAELAAQVK